MVGIAQPIRKRKKAKANAPSRKRKYLGLCSSCKEAPTCTYKRDLKRQVWQCEEFDGYEPRSVNTKVKNISPQAGSKVRSSAEEKDSGEYKGLCCICEDRKTCTFPRPEGGIWHCEEYR
jgi:acetyl-CoA carboxylase beta subunit